MKYINAKAVLPEALVRDLQDYIQAGYVYIPATGEKKRWGEKSGYRRELQARNTEIRLQYQLGRSMASLAEQYALSIHAIKKIIYQK